MYFLFVYFFSVFLAWGVGSLWLKLCIDNDGYKQN